MKLYFDEGNHNALKILIASKLNKKRVENEKRKSEGKCFPHYRSEAYGCIFSIKMMQSLANANF